MKRGSYSGWAIVELLGHRTVAGYITEAPQYGTDMVLVEISVTVCAPSPRSAQLLRCR